MTDATLRQLALGVMTVRWLSVDGHTVDGHYVVCHLGRIALRKLPMSLVVYIALLNENPIQVSLRSRCIIRSHPYTNKG
jgi:hypothetical protein